MYKYSLKERIALISIIMSFIILSGCSHNKNAVKPIESTMPPSVENIPSQAVKINPTVIEEPAIKESVLQFSTIYFDFDKTTVRTDQRQALNDNARLLSTNTNIRILIEGHCDERGTDLYNLALGQSRADAIKMFLTDYGIDPTRINTLSYGEERPYDRGHDETAWSKNRRCEFSVIK